MQLSGLFLLMTNLNREHLLKFLFYLALIADGIMGVITLGFYGKPELSCWVAERMK